MIKLINLDRSEPYSRFKEIFNKAKKNNQPAIDAICVSSYCKLSKEVDSRYVNLKYIDGNEWIFFTNYNSKKAIQFKNNNNISVAIYWSNIDAQIRIKAKIKKTRKNISDHHYRKRNASKNALAHSSSQSNKIDSYERIQSKYNNFFNNPSLIKERPKHWGGYSFYPYQFEFWIGHADRLNYREVFERNGKIWNKSILEP